MHFSELKNIIPLSAEARGSDEPYDLVMSNINTLNALFSYHIKLEEMCLDSVQSYYVDYYIQQVNNGGFSQFVYNSGWNNRVVDYVRGGLLRMGATANLAIFNRGAECVDALGDRLDEYLESDYFGTNEQRDFLNSIDKAIWSCQENESLVNLNAKWLNDNSKSLFLKEDTLSEFLNNVSELVPDIEARRQRALDSEPRCSKIVRKLCEAGNFDFEVLTTWGKAVFEGNTHVALHLRASNQHFYMVDLESRAVLIDDNGAIASEIHDIEDIQ